MDLLARLFWLGWLGWPGRDAMGCAELAGWLAGWLARLGWAGWVGMGWSG